MNSMPPIDAEEMATRAFRAPHISYCTHRQGHSGVTDDGFVLVLNNPVLPSQGSPHVDIHFEGPILRPDAAALFGNVAEALFSEMEI